MVYKVYKAGVFEKIFGKLDKSMKIQIEKAIENIRINPYSGKPLGYKFFREKKIRNYRIYYLIYNEYIVVYFVGISSKKDQQEIINQIRALMPSYKQEIKKRFNFCFFSMV